MFYMLKMHNRLSRSATITYYLAVNTVAKFSKFMKQVKLQVQQVNYLTIDANYHGQRIDNFLLGLLKGVPKSLVYRIIRKGEVRVNKKRIKAEYKLQLGDAVRIPPVRMQSKGEVVQASASLLTLLQESIVYEDDAIMALNKPSGLAVHGGSGVRLGMIEALRQDVREGTFLELVHRLDRDTSGLVLVAKKRAALVALQRMLAQKQGISKQYLALVHGFFPAEITQIDAALTRTERASGERMVVVDAKGKAAKTLFQVLAKGKHYSLLRAEPITGRTHQIRVHSQFAGHVLAGDEKYASSIERDIDKQYQIKRLFLHARRLSFAHPLKPDTPIFIEAKLDAHWLNALDTQKLVGDISAAQL